MLIFSPCHFPLQNAPIPNCSAALLPLGAEVGQRRQCRAKPASPWGRQEWGRPPPQCTDAKSQSGGLPREGKP